MLPKSVLWLKTINKEKHIEIGVVGACGSGKSSLVDGLSKHGYSAHHIAQEHSFAPSMWQRITNPDILIYLHVTYPITLQRKNFTWKEKEYQEQINRLEHARRHADMEIQTDGLTPDQVLEIVLTGIMGKDCMDG